MKSRFGLVLSSLFAGGVIVYFLFSLWKQWQTGLLENFTYSITGILTSMLGMVGLVVLMALLWRWLLELLVKKKPSLKAVLKIQILSWLGRYMPGKVGMLLGKVLLGKEIGLPGAALASSVLYEHLLFISSGFSIVLLTLGSSVVAKLISIDISVMQVILLVGVILISAPYLIKTAFYLLEKIMTPGDHKDIAVLSLQNTGLMFLGYHLAHISAGAGFFLLLHTLIPGIGITALSAVGIITAAHLAGILAFFAPAGLGVRESVMTWLLLPYMSLDNALSISILTRAWSTVADGILMGGLLLLRSGKRPVQHR
ncbi:hypothetical protein [Sulfuricaulis limicola]|uniref:hypothetical protein n=1 Tax=Sulfuricaulis limicola TaxID=1620215 RepID=UPI0011E4D1C2|nr:hypothetical protein [Sulfuricaulis limicola]